MSHEESDLFSFFRSFVNVHAIFKMRFKRKPLKFVVRTETSDSDCATNIERCLVEKQKLNTHYYQIHKLTTRMLCNVAFFAFISCHSYARVFERKDSIENYPVWKIGFSYGICMTGFWDLFSKQPKMDRENCKIAGGSKEYRNMFAQHWWRLMFRWINPFWCLCAADYSATVTFWWH